MPRLFATSLTIYAVGCVIPTPLEAEPVDTHHQPVIVAGDPGFDSEPIIEKTASKWNLGVTVSDENTTDTLYYGIYWHDGGKLRTLVGNEVEIPPSGTAMRATAYSDTVQFCAFFGSASVNYVRAYVQDLPLPKDPNSMQTPPALEDPLNPDHLTGRYDFKEWPVSCQ